MGAPQGQDVYNMKVNNLLHTNVKEWDSQKIGQLFFNDVASKIMQVPLLKEVNEDCLVWKEEQNGVYNVKIGYKLCMQGLCKHKGRSVLGDWHSLWKIRAPSKTKHLLCRTCRS